MSKKSTKALASATLMSLVLTTALSAGPVKAAEGKVTRVGEVDRYATAAKVATQNWKTSDNVVLVCAEGSDAYADAVSASALAKKLDAPILLTTTKSLSTDTKGALATLKAKNVYVVGGTAAVSQSVRDELKKDYSVTELGGANRYETNAKVAEKLVELGVKADEVIMVGGEGFSDALSVAPIAAAKGQILLLGMNNADYMKPVIDFVNKNKSKVTVVGTENVISSSIYNKVNAASRVDGGSDRFDTNLKVLAAFKDTVKKDKMYIANASGDGYADALVGSAVAGKTGSPLILVDTDGSSATTNAIKYIKDNGTTKTDLNVIGGTGVVSQNVEEQINKAINPTPDVTDNTVKSIEAVNLNEIKIHFNGAIDSDSAEDVTNYRIDGVSLTQPDANDKATDSNAAVAHAIDDNTVSIVFAKQRKQNDKVGVTVKKGVYTKDKSKIFNEFNTPDVVFKDGDAPTVKKVSMEGNSQLTVEFSEAVNMKTINDLRNKFKIDGQSLGNVNTEYSKIKNKLVVDNDKYGKVGTWSYKVMFYFDSKIEKGDHTLKISGGDLDGALCDAAGYTFQESTENFSVDDMSTKPAIKSIKETTPGEVHVTFDRSMDVQTAKDPSNWELNGKKLPTSASFDTDDADATIKIKGLGKNIQTGSNVMYIKNNVKDAYGNKVPDDTRPNFENLKDDTKPTVLNAERVDSETISVKFNKTVDYKFATSTSNYKLLDNKDVDITSHIDKIISYKGEGNTDDTDTYKIKIKRANPTDAKDDWRLTGSKYTLTVKNIIDTASSSNRMDDWTHELTGTSDVAPSGVGMYAKLGKDNNSNKDSVVIYFSAPMNGSDLLNKDNYQFINGKGDPKSLPSDASISVGTDGKSVTIEFPTSYSVKTTGKDATTDKEYDVLSLTVANVKDESGNALSGVAYNNSGKIDEAKQGAAVKENTIKTRYDNDDLKVDVQFTKEIDKTNASDFKVGGVTPSSITKKGDLVTLTFKDGMAATADEIKAVPVTYAGKMTNTHPTKIELVKSQGQNAKLTIDAKGTTDETGALVSTDKDGLKPVTLNAAQSTIYDAQAAPRTTCFNSHDDHPEFWTATKDNDGGKVYITFDAPLNSNSGIQDDDITFSGDGTTIKADKVVVDADHPNTLVFSFNKTNKDYASFNGDLDISIKPTIKLQSVKDADGNTSTYTPSSDDIKSRLVTIKDTSSKDDGKVDLTSIKADTAKLPYSTVVTFKLSVANPENYNVTVKGKAASFDTASGSFGVAVDGTYTADKFTQADFVVTEKSAPVTTKTVDLTSITADTAKLPYSTVLTFKLAGVTDPQNYNVTVKGKAASYDATSGLFGAAVDGTYTADKFTQADFVVTQK